MRRSRLIPAAAAGLLAALLPVAAIHAAGSDAAPAGAVSIPSAAEVPVDQGVRLLMVEREGCIYCRKWRHDVLPGYALTGEGRAAPLATVPLDGPWPDGLALARRPFVTPTFVLLRDGRELARIEGYVGEDAFWPRLRDMLAGNGIALPGTGG